MADYKDIAGRIRTTASDGVSVEAQEILDISKNKKQSQINAETDTTLANHASAIQGLNSQNYGTYTATDQTTAETDVLPAEGSEDTIYRLGNWDGTQYDVTCYSEYSWNGSAYVHISTKPQISEVFDISAYHASGGTLATYSDLNDALNGTNGGIPQSLQKGGMSVKFVHTSDNKYVQARCMAQNYTTDVTQWQAVDDIPTAGSDNLVKSGGIAAYIVDDKLNLLFGCMRRQGYYHDGTYYSNIRYDVFELEVTSGTTYYISPFRFISKSGSKINDRSNEEKYAYTADFTGILYITFDKENPRWVVTNNSDTFDLARPFNTPSLTKFYLQQAFGLNKNLAYSQFGIHEYLKKVLNEYNLIYTSFLKKNYYHDGNYRPDNSYNVYEINVESGVSYTLSPGLRYISKTGSTIESYPSRTSEDVTYTPDYTGILFATYHFSATNICVCKTSDLASVGMFNINVIAHALGDNDNTPISQKAVKQAITDMPMKVGADMRNLLFSAKQRVLGYYYNSSYEQSELYEVFEIEVTSGTTYYISPFRFISKQGINIQGETFDYSSYTADFTGILYITFKRANPGWIVSTINFITNPTSNIRPFDIPSLIETALGQTFGIRKDRPYSQYGTIALLNSRFFNQYNLLNFSTLTENRYHNGVSIPDASYDFYTVKVESGISYTISPSIRMISKQGTKLVDYPNKTSEDVTYTPDYTGELFISFVKHNDIRYVCKTEDISKVGTLNEYMIANELGDNSFIPISQNGVKQAIEQAIAQVQISNVLYGKKWVACGDSFTEGDFTGLTDITEYKFQDVPYKNENKVYPYFIGRRTGAVVINEAKGGSTMAYIDGSRHEFSTPDGRYTQIPSDADYITLYFGINDSHQNVPIGTIDDVVNTTFYGAWNIVMEYLITNHPNAKIGIIISNGCDTIDYPNAEIAIAKKWGVAYFDINGDPKIPLVFRVNGKPDLSTALLQQRYLQYRVSATNGHPNAACHEDESYFIESWLKSI